LRFLRTQTHRQLYFLHVLIPVLVPGTWYYSSEVVSSSDSMSRVSKNTERFIITRKKSLAMTMWRDFKSFLHSRAGVSPASIPRESQPYPWHCPAHWHALSFPYRTSCEDGITPQSPPLEQECDVCFYTGIATCAGLSLYFLKAATDLPDAPLTKELRGQKRFLITMGSVSAMAGAYRWYLG
jgi:hypothetical protein